MTAKIPLNAGRRRLGRSAGAGWARAIHWLRLFLLLAASPAYSGPFIAVQPQSQSVCLGETVYFDTFVFGGAYFEWRFNQTNILAAGNSLSNLVVGGVTESAAGQYTVVATNLSGASTSSVAVLTVGMKAPWIYGQPGDVMTGEGYPVVFTVWVDPCGPHTYQWQHDGMDLCPTNGTNTTLVIPSASRADLGRYWLIITNSYASITSTVVSLTFTQAAPAFVVQPLSTAVDPGALISLAALAEGAPRPAYQWYFGHEPVVDGTNSSLSIAVTSGRQSGDYFVVATNRIGSATSEVAHLAVLVEAPVISPQPASQEALVGASVLFNSFAAGKPKPSYQWLLNGAALAGATNPALSLSGVTQADAGSYQLVASNEVAAVTSQVARLEVTLPGPIDAWAWRHPFPQGSDLFGVAVAHGEVVAVGDDGQVVRFRDATDMRAARRGLSERRKLAFGNEIFVALLNGALETSEDGEHWVAQDPGTLPYSDYVQDLVFGQGQFVAVGSGLAGGGLVLVSTNGTNWTRQSIPVDLGLVGICYSEGSFLAVSRLGAVYRSSDATQWTLLIPAPGTTLVMTAVARWSDRIVIAGYESREVGTYPLILSAGADLQWERWTSDQPALLFDVTAGNGVFVAVGGAGSRVILTSTDGRTWTNQAPPSDGELFTVDYLNERFVAVGRYGNILTSTNGADWLAISAGTGRNLRSVEYGAGRYVAAGNLGLVLTSEDGIEWTPRDVGTTNNLRGITYGQGRFVAVGAPDANGGTFATSADGVHWQVGRFAEQGFFDVIFAGGLFVAAGDPGVATSTDGTSWTLRVTAAAGTGLNAIAYGQGRFVTVGMSGRILGSENGLEWSELNSGTTGDLQAVAFGGGRWMAAGKTYFSSTSVDGVNWTANRRPTNRDIEDLTYADGRFVAVGESGLLATTLDGTVWTTHDPGMSRTLRGILYADGRLLAVGNNEVILQSSHLAPATLRSWRNGGQGFGVTIEGEANRGYVLQVSTQLQRWDEVLRYTNDTGRTNYAVPSASGSPRRFYRAMTVD